MSYFGLVDGNSVSTLFGSVSSSNSATNLTILSDYASIKNGSYHKLLNAYYNGNSKVNSIVGDTTATSKDSAKKLTNLQEDSDNLKEAADALYTTGKESVFKEKDIKQEDGTTKKGYDVEEIYKKVNKFVEAYNELVESSEDVSSDSVAKAMKNLNGTVDANARLLAKIGISIKSDGTLELDKDTFKASDMNRVKDVFNGTGSFGYQISARASIVDFTAQREATKANTYNQYGTYTNNYNYSYNDYF